MAATITSRKLAPAENIPQTVLGDRSRGDRRVPHLRAVHRDATFFQTLVKSLALGSIYAIIALGFVLIFKATEVVNFAQGALAMSGALFMSFVVNDEHIPFTDDPQPDHRHRRSGLDRLGPEPDPRAGVRRRVRVW